MLDPAHAPTLDSEAERSAGLRRLRRVWLTRLLAVVAVAAVAWAAWYFLFARNRVSTDNAYVNAEMAQVTPLISGSAVAVLVKDTQLVRRGDVLVRLDATDAQIAVAQAEADLANARRQFRQSLATGSALNAQVSARGAEIAQAQARVAAAQAEADKARTDLRRRQSLAGSGAVSGEELTQAREAFATAQANLATARAGIAQAQFGQRSARGELAANQALVGNGAEASDPGVLAAQARLRAARLDIDRAVIRAPVDGVVTRRQVQLGQRVTQGSPIMIIAPVSQVYVDANFKERQLRRVRIGMPATVTADLYGGDIVYHGRVAGIAGGTGASMALIPAQNATGNWIKVVQRLPVRIELDPRELKAHPLRVGLSTEVEIELVDE